MTDLYLRPGPSQFSLTEQEAYATMELFLAQFLSRGAVDMPYFRHMINVLSDGDASDPAQWHDWLNCVRLLKRQPADAVTNTWAKMPNPPTVRRL